ncbi:MAG: outer membrane protein assembly factor BamD [Desulfobacterota bacterium]|nr:outer membrane protein assembly factor BamD [Thermodesulfobacteriota bacterium]
MKKQLIALGLALVFAGAGCTTPPPPKKPAYTDAYYYEKALGLFKARNFIEAVPAFEELRDKFPLSPYAVLAELRLGEAHYHQDQFIEATHYFENFRRLHPTNPQVPYSIYMTGMCHYQQILSIDRDQTFAEAALEQFQQLVDLYPRSPYAGPALCKIAEIKKHLAQHECFVGNFYLRTRNYKGAIERFNKVLRQYPLHIEQDKVLFLIADATTRSGDALRGAKILEYLIATYPESPYAREARKKLGTQPQAPQP